MRVLTLIAFLHLLVSSQIAAGQLAESDTEQSLDRIKTDLLIVGGTESGWAAAIQARTIIRRAPGMMNANPAATPPQVPCNRHPM